MPESTIRLRVLCALVALMALGNIGWFLLHGDLKGARRHLHHQHIFVTRNNFIDAIRTGNKDNVRDFITLGANAGMQLGTDPIIQSKDNKGNAGIRKAPPMPPPPPAVLQSKGHADAGSPPPHPANASAATLDGTSALLAAIDSGNDEILRMVLATVERPKNPLKPAQIVNLQDANHRTALIAAVERNDAGLVGQLLSWGADPDLVNSVSESPLIIAVKHKYTGLVQPLIDADIKARQSVPVINIFDNKGNTPLAYAILQGDEALVKTLIAAKADVASPNLLGVTPLMAAEHAGNFSIARLLLSAGAKPDVADKSGNTPLTLAIAQGNIEFAELLLRSGADPDFQTTGKMPLQVAIEAKPFHADFFNALLAQSKKVDSIREVLLFSAVDSGNIAIVNTMLARGLSPQIRNAGGETLLYHALQAGAEDIALLLLDKGADAKETGIRDLTPLECAVRHNAIKAAKKLLSLGASPAQKNAQGYPLAETAMYLGEPEILEMLLAGGASVEKDKGLVYWSERTDGSKTVSLLLAHGANPDAMNSEGDPALWLAASTGSPETVEALIHHHATLNLPPDHKENVTRLSTPHGAKRGSHGAANDEPHRVTEVVDHYGIPPLAIACRLNRLAVVKLLIAAGAGLEIKDHSGMTPLAHAVSVSNPDIVQYLLAKGADRNATDEKGRSVIDLAKLAPPSDARAKVLALLAAHP